MAEDRNSEAEFDTLKNGSTDTAAVEAYYNDWSARYDKELADWDYTAPDVATAMLTEHLQPGSKVLDLGCGTGQFAEKLSNRLECRINGVDISKASLKKAGDRGCYSSLRRVDLQQTPLPFADNSFDGAASVGVMTYIADPTALLADLCRIIHPGGAFVFTHRDDLWHERNFDDMIAGLIARGLCEVLKITEPKPYIPKHEDFTDQIKVKFALLKVS
jgi:predicted TPR repeat methyltransferase